MRFRNDGNGEAHILQNQFTRYLITSIRRRKIDFLNQRDKLYASECSVDSLEDLPQLILEEADIFDVLMEYIDLELVLSQFSKRNRYIFYAHLSGKRTFSELAQELGLGYKGVADAYYRVIRKIRVEMRGDGK